MLGTEGHLGCMKIPQNGVVFLVFAERERHGLVIRVADYIAWIDFVLCAQNVFLVTPQIIVNNDDLLAICYELVKWQ